MGNYYYLLNDTKKQCIDFDAHIKASSIKYNEIVHMAFVNYMLEHGGDSFRIVSDCGNTQERSEYEEIDLKTYEFEDKEVTTAIKDKTERQLFISVG